MSSTIPKQCAGKRVLDFASGSGLVAIAARLAGAANVVAADIDPFCATAIKLNAEANGVAVDSTAAISSAPTTDGTWCWPAMFSTTRPSPTA